MKVGYYQFCPEFGKPSQVVLGQGVFTELLLDGGSLPHLEVVLLSEHGGLPVETGTLAKQRMDQDAALRVHHGPLPEVVQGIAQLRHEGLHRGRSDGDPA